MKLRAYTIYDRKGLVFNTPYFSHNDQTATRSFSDLVNDANSAVALHPSDYVLFRVAEYDDQTGGLVPVSPVKHICDALTLVRKPPLLTPELAGVTRDTFTKDMFNGEDR